MTYTKRQYIADIAANTAALERVTADIEAIRTRYEKEGATEEITEAYNVLHDREWQLQQDRREIERKWSTRKWTYTDHMSARLVAANID